MPSQSLLEEQRRVIARAVESNVAQSCRFVQLRLSAATASAQRCSSIGDTAAAPRAADDAHEQQVDSHRPAAAAAAPTRALIAAAEAHDHQCDVPSPDAAAKNYDDRPHDGVAMAVAAFPCSACGRPYHTQPELQQHQQLCKKFKRMEKRSGGGGENTAVVDHPPPPPSPGMMSTPPPGRVKVIPTNDLSPEPKRSRVPPHKPVPEVESLPAVAAHAPDFEHAVDPEKPREEEPMEDCPHCGRHLLASRISRHVGACDAKRKKERAVFTEAWRNKSTSDGSPAQAASNPVPQTRWREKSAQLHNALFGGSSGAMIEVDDGREQCPACGRKFDSEVAKKHIPRCVERASRALRK